MSTSEMGAVGALVAVMALVKYGVIVFALVLMWRVMRAVERMAAYMERSPGGNIEPDR